MDSFPIKIGDAVEVSKTITESDVYLFAEITGDFSPNHVNEELMRNSLYKHRIVHGALIVGFMSTASSTLIAKFGSARSDQLPVSLGYDRIRFIEPVFIGDTVTVAYEITAVDQGRHRSTADIVVTNQIGKKVTVANHILKWVATKL
jgi:acyl dehydratase